MNTFSKVAGYKIYSQNSLTLLYLGVILIKQMKDLFDKNLKSLKKEIGDAIRRWKDLPCSWIGRVNIVKCPSYQKQYIYSVRSYQNSNSSSHILKGQFSASYGKAHTNQNS